MEVEEDKTINESQESTKSTESGLSNNATSKDENISDKKDTAAEDDDLEDGEIETDDENEVPVVASETAKSVQKTETVKITSSQEKSSTERSLGKKKAAFVDDDWAGNIENAIAAALKKEGKEPPPRPKIEKREEPRQPEEPPVRDKPKKRKKKSNEKVKAKKSRKIEETRNESDIDDYEMLCVRGGSPPPRDMGPQHPYYESEDSASSYESYDSGPDYRKHSYDDRRQGRRGNRDRHNKQKNKRPGRGNDKRRHNRRDSDGSDDGRHDKKEPRQMELCKFYLMECCAKKENCSYMHGDFPCKYYYLGMPCIYNDECKFSHGKPLTDQLRNILLKHIETAPKEILGKFRRISRDSALQLINAAHAKICADFGVENTLAPTATTQTVTTAHSALKSSNNLELQQQSLLSSSSAPTSIPSLLDMVIKPPQLSPQVKDKDKMSKGDKARKSRWAGNTMQSGNALLPAPEITPKPTLLMGMSAPGAIQSIPTNASIPSYLSLQNLTGVITQEQIQKLSAMGIQSLEQINQLTVAQLNNIGLTINQINQIQLNALNLQKLGLISNPETNTSPSMIPSISQQQQQAVQLSLATAASIASATAGIATSSLINDVTQSTMTSSATPATMLSSATASLSGGLTPFSSDGNANSLSQLSNQDVDMRFLVVPPPASSTGINSNPSSAAEINENNSSMISGNSNSNLPNSQSQQSTDKLTDTGIASPEPILSSDNSIHNNVDKNLQSTNSSQSVLGIDGSSKDSFNDASSYPSNNSNIVDYSQYLKDSHLDAEKTDLNDINLDYKDDDALDEPELQIDESWGVDDDNTNDNPQSSDEDEESKDDSQDAFKIDTESSLPRPMPAVYDPKLLSQTTLTQTNKVDVSSSVSNMYLNVCSSIQDKLNHETKPVESTQSPNRASSETRELRDPRLMRCSQTSSIASADEYGGGVNKSPSYGNRSPASVPMIKDDLTQYSRTSIYDGNPDDDEPAYTSRKHDEDMRMSPFMDAGSDMALRLPFKPVMTNYTPATEIDGSISSHAPIQYVLYEVEIPKPNYAEIRRSVKVTDKTLDPRLRRIFCLKESSNSNSEQFTSDADFTIGGSSKSSDVISSPSSLASNTIGTMSTIVSSGPRLDPRRKKDHDSAGNSSSNPSGAVTSSSLSGIGINSPSGSQSLDMRTLLQKSDWYKNLNSKFKIMVNQQLALVSNELKRFHQDPSPKKVFNMQFITSNQNLQQILTNMGVYIDENGEVQQIEDGDNINMDIGGSAGSIGNQLQQIQMHQQQQQQQQQQQAMSNLLPNPGGLGNVAGSMGMSMEYMRLPPPVNIAPRFMGNPLNPFVARFGDARPGLLGVAPGVPFGMFDGGNRGVGPVLDGNFGGGGTGNEGGGNLSDCNPFNQAGNFFGNIVGADMAMGGGGLGDNSHSLGIGSGGGDMEVVRSGGGTGGGGSGGGGNRSNRNFRNSNMRNKNQNERWRNNSGGGGNSNNSGGSGGGSGQRRDK